ncbi:MAG: hypothetical protein ACK48D_01975 [Pseudanabaena sp.]
MTSYFPLKLGQFGNWRLVIDSGLIRQLLPSKFLKRRSPAVHPTGECSDAQSDLPAAFNIQNRL